MELNDNFMEGGVKKLFIYIMIIKILEVENNVNYNKTLIVKVSLKKKYDFLVRKIV